MKVDKSHGPEFMDLSAQMLAAAQRGDWDGLVSLEARRAKLINSENSGVLPNAAFLDTVAIQTVQASDKETLRLVANRMSEINDVFKVSPMVRRLTRTYSDMANQL
jgi:hypothetical protein